MKIGSKQVDIRTGRKGEVTHFNAKHVWLMIDGERVQVPRDKIRTPRAWANTTGGRVLAREEKR